MSRSEFRKNDMKSVNAYDLYDSDEDVSYLSPNERREIFSFLDNNYNFYKIGKKLHTNNDNNGTNNTKASKIYL